MQGSINNKTLLDREFSARASCISSTIFFGIAGSRTARGAEEGKEKRSGFRQRKAGRAGAVERFPAANVGAPRRAINSVAAP
jgi:hypothetical protein